MGKFDWNMDLLSQLIPSKKGVTIGGAKAEETPEPTPEDGERLNAILETTTYMFNLGAVVCSIKDKLIFSTMLTFSILLKDGNLSTAEYNGACIDLSNALSISPSCC